MLALAILAALFATAMSLSCSDLGLISGGHPKVTKVKSFSGNSPETSSITWETTSTEDASLSSTVACAEGTGDISNYLIISSTGIPAHQVGNFPMTFETTGSGRNDNPNTISPQTYSWKIPKTLQIKSTMPSSVLEDNKALSMGPVAFALNGVPFFNPYNLEGKDAVSTSSNGYEVMDLCHGHPDMRGAYHYHYQQQTDGCLFGSTGAQVTATVGQRSPKIGYAFDGIPIYGPLGKGGVKPTDLDKCNGRMDADLGQYVYHTTDFTAPYVIGCYRYQLTPSSEPSGETPTSGGFVVLPTLLTVLAAFVLLIL
eukprot:m.309572 g.309572  ORF g.309572 m.309572 type:complete len:312 (+) comp46970_c0_seq1:69-1004(+)